MFYLPPHAPARASPFPPTDHHLELPITLGSEAIGPAVPGHEMLSGGGSWWSTFSFWPRCLKKAGVALRAVWFGMIIFGFYFILLDHRSPLSLLASLPPKRVQ